MIITRELLETNSEIASVVETLDKDKQLDRYVGLRPFVKKDSLVFFGRNSEIEKLVTSVRVNQVFILYGKSGLGKSSLVQAGLVPKLIEDGVGLITIRFYNKEVLANEIKENPVEIIATEIAKKLSITPTAEQIQSPVALLNYLPKNETLLLIFDQFEEFLYYPRDIRKTTIKLMRDLISYASLNKITNTGVVKLLFLIRSDRLYLMKELEKKIPGILNCSYELTPLTVDKAEEAMVLPVQINLFNEEKNIFKTTSFDYSTDALRIILNTLKNNEGEIESSQLQIVCKELEEIAYNKFNTTEILNNRVLEPADFKGEAGIKNILNEFYLKQIEKLKTDPDLKLSDKDIKKIKILIENDLVSGNKRIIQSEERVKEVIRNIKPGINQINDVDKIEFVVDKLLSLRLIREEDSHLGKVYEITHDTLLPSIIESKNERRKKEQTNKMVKRAFSILAVITIIFGFAFYFSSKNYDNKKLVFEKQKGDLLLKTSKDIKLKKDSIQKAEEALLTQNEKNNALNDMLNKRNKILNEKVNELKLALAEQKVLSENNINLYHQDTSLINSLVHKSKIDRDTIVSQVKQIAVLNSLRNAAIGKDTVNNRPNKFNAPVKDLQTKTYSQSWFNAGYFLQFDNIKVFLKALNKRTRVINVRICDIIGAADCKVPIDEPNINLNETYRFNYNGNAYSLTFNKIANPGGISSQAAFITFKKN